MNGTINSIREGFCNSSDAEFVVMFLSIMVLGALAGILLHLIFEKDKGYMQGQIDAANGIMNYELRSNEYGETVWVEKEDNEILDQ